MNDYDVSKELCTKVSKELEEFCVNLFKKQGVVRGKSMSKYGDGFEYKIEAYSNEEITKGQATLWQSAIDNYARQVFGRNDLQLVRNSTKFGAGFQIKITADLVVEGKNGVNLASTYARDFRYSRWSHELPEETLGKPAQINGKTVYLAGVVVKKNGDLQPVVLTDGVYRIFTNPAVLQQYWGKKLVEAK